MKFAIRDDDISHFTKPDELEKAYDFIDHDYISLSVVPYTVPVHKDTVFPYGEGIKYGFYDIGENDELVYYLREGIDNSKYNILLHGFSHEYKKINGSWETEMIWKSNNQLFRELTEGKQYLELLFGQRINVFVMPNNMINQKAKSVLEYLGMDYSGITQIHGRKINSRYIVNFVRRWNYRIIYRIPYPGILNFGKNKEFVVYTHYWQLNQDASTKELLRKITDYVCEDGVELVSLSEVFEE